MPPLDIELKPVTHITTDALGPPGKRVFYIQGTNDTQTVTIILEKVQVQSLAVGIEQFLAEIHAKFPELPEPLPDYVEEQMHITPPVDPLFRAGEIGLGYERESDLVVLIISEIATGSEEEELSQVRLWCTRSQLRALGRWGLEVAARGRPICPQCGEPMDPQGHFCVKKNGGHARK